MLVGIISDPHANLPAVEAVLEDTKSIRPDALVCLGDFVGYGAQPNEVIEVLSGVIDAALVGNHDLAALGEVDIDLFNPPAAMSAVWTADVLSGSSVSFLSALAPRGSFRGLDLAHASFRDPVWEYVQDARIASVSFDVSDFTEGFVGHTHVPAIFVEEGAEVTGGRIELPVDTPSLAFEIPEGHRALLNPGSVGQPRDGDPRASWAIWDTKSRSFTLRRIEYPIGEAQSAIRAAGLPSVLADRLAEGW